MANLLYSLPFENVSTFGTVSSSLGTVDTALPLANARDLNPALPAGWTTTTADIIWDFGSAVQLDVIAIPHHNLTAGLGNVWLEGNATNVWTTPSLTQLLTVPSADASTFSTGFFKDLTGIGSRSFRYWRFSVRTANASPVKIGEIMLIQIKRTLVNNLEWGLRETFDHEVFEHKTDYKTSLIYDTSTTIRGIKGRVQTTAAGAQAIENWWVQSNGRARPFLVVLDPDVNKCMMARWKAQPFEIERDALDNNIFDLEFEEVSRGLQF